MEARTQLGVLVYLASDLMLFAPFFAAYYLLRTGNQPWPPPGIDLGMARAAIATLVLVSSSATMVAADRAHARRDLSAMRTWLLATIVLGGAFLANQLADYATLSFQASDHVYGSIYWLLTGLHTAHVTAGLLLLVALTVRIRRVEHAHDLTTWAAGASAFWHLVDVVWVAVFITIWIVR